MDDQELAGRFFDLTEASGLRNSGMSQEGIDYLRSRYVEAATANPQAMIELRDWQRRLE